MRQCPEVGPRRRWLQHEGSALRNGIRYCRRGLSLEQIHCRWELGPFLFPFSHPLAFCHGMIQHEDLIQRLMPCSWVSQSPEPRVKQTSIVYKLLSLWYSVIVAKNRPCTYVKGTSLTHRVLINQKDKNYLKEMCTKDIYLHI